MKRASLINLITGYLMMTLFVVLVLSGRPINTVVVAEYIEDIPEALVEDINDVDIEPVPVILDPEGREIVYIDRDFVRDNDIGLDLARNHLVVTDGANIVQGRTITNLRDDRGGHLYVDNDRSAGIIRGRHDTIHNRTNGGYIHNGDAVVGRNHTNHHDDYVRVDEDVDLGILDRRLHDVSTDTTNADVLTDDDKYGIDGDDLGNLTVDSGDDDDISIDAFTNEDGFGPDGLVADRGDLYAYNYPSQGVGAGIGNPGVGAVAGFAGIGAGIGEAVLNGKTVPTLGGIGTYSTVATVPPGTGTDTDNDGLETETEIAIGTDPTNSDSDGDGFSDGAEIASYTDPSNPISNPDSPGSGSKPSLGGVGGLVGGAGAGGAAGLVTGSVKEQLGIGIAPGVGCAVHGAGCDGHHGHGKHEYDLPPDGALHIMMHVDGSGSILNTRKQLDIMKGTLLKEALLPYYNNDEDLYDRRVTIVDGSGERSLRFFTEAAKKDNVLAIAFQDEAQPVYHLPTFNKKPENNYLDDLGKLKASLNGYGGVYRGVMFQVDRGKTFAKSFKEFVECAWRGEGYLETANLKRYYKDNNLHHIKNKDGIVFSDEYHAKSEGDPQYYMDLILDAAKKVGLNLRAQGAGLVDGKYNNKN